jgi:hypothetical protein
VQVGRALTVPIAPTVRVATRTLRDG